MAPERGFERKGDSLPLFSRCAKTADRREACYQTQRSLRRKRVVPIARPWATTCAARRHQRRRGGARGAVESQNEVPRSPGATHRRQFGSRTTPWCPPGPTLVRQCDATARRSYDGARIRAPPNTPKWPRGRPRRRARASRRRKRSHRPQTRPRDVNLGPLSPPVPPGAALVRRCVVTARSAPANRPRV